MTKQNNKERQRIKEVNEANKSQTTFGQKTNLSSTELGKTFKISNCGIQKTFELLFGSS